VSDGCANGTRQLIRQLQSHRCDLTVNGDQGQVAQPLHGAMADGVLEREALQQFAALCCIQKEPQGAVLGPLAGGGGAGLDERISVLGLGLR